MFDSAKWLLQGALYGILIVVIGVVLLFNLLKLLP